MSVIWRIGGAWLWRVAYLRLVASSFRTVPFYRERWALDGRTDPVVVAGRIGTNGGAVAVDEALRRRADLVPLAGGNPHPDPLRGTRHVRFADGAVLHDPTLGFLGWRGPCHHWHLDWSRVYARETGAGLAFTLLRQRSPRLVDILVPGVGTRLGICPRHGTPVVRP